MEPDFGVEGGVSICGHDRDPSLLHFAEAMRDQCLSDPHSLIFRLHGNRSEYEYIDSLLEGQSTEEYGANDLLLIDSHETMQISTVGAGNQFPCQVADKRAFLLTFRPGEHRHKKAFYGCRITGLMGPEFHY